MRLNFLQRGFTIIELLIAVGVLVILVGVAIPQFLDYTNKGEDAAAQADGRAFLTAVVGASGQAAEAEKAKDGKSEGGK